MGACIGIKQQLVGIEPVSGLWRVGPVHAIAVDGAGPRIRQIAVPDLVGIFGQLDTVELVAAGRIKQAQLDLGCVCGEQREVDTQSVPGGAQRMGKPLGQP